MSRQRIVTGIGFSVATNPFFHDRVLSAQQQTIRAHDKALRVCDKALGMRDRLVQ